MVSQLRLLRSSQRLRATYERMLQPLRVVWMTLLVGLVLVYLARNFGSVVDLAEDMGLGAMVLVIALVVVAKVVYSEQARLSYHLAGGPRLGASSFYRVYTISDMAKYIPGGVWGVAARVKSYLRFGVSAKDAARGFGFEKANLLVSALFGGAVLASVGLEGGLRQIVDDRLSIGSGARLFEVSVIIVAWVLATWVTGSVLLPESFEPRHVVRILVEHGAIVVLLGLGVWIPARAAGADLNIWLALGAFNIGRAVGLVAVFAPAGVGVREAVGLWVIRHENLDDVALFAFGASRVLTTVAEAATFAVVGLLVRSGRMSLPGSG